MIIGADLDLDGAVVALDDSGKFVDHIRYPTMPHNSKGRLKRRIDCPALLARLQEFVPTDESVEVYLEWPGVIMSNGMLQSASQHRTVGNVEACLGGVGLDCRYVPVREWKRNFNLMGKPKKSVIPIANRLCDMDVQKVKDTPIAEAALIARYGMRKARAEGE